MLATKDDYLMALAKAHKDPDSSKLIETLIEEHFALMEHLRKTPLYDVLEYEKRLVEPMRILIFDNERLKKEVNKLRRELGKIEKYKEADT